MNGPPVKKLLNNQVFRKSFAILWKKIKDINKGKLLRPLDACAVANRLSLSKKGCTLGLLCIPKIVIPRAKLYFKSGQNIWSRC